MSAMTTVYDKKRQEQEETAVVVATGAQVVDTPEISIVGTISSMIARNKSFFKLPTLSRANISIFTTAMLSGATQISDAVSPDIKCEASSTPGVINPSNIVAASVATIGSVVSGGYAIHRIFDAC